MRLSSAWALAQRWPSLCAPLDKMQQSETLTLARTGRSNEHLVQSSVAQHLASCASVPSSCQPEEARWTLSEPWQISVCVMSILTCYRTDVNQGGSNMLPRKPRLISLEKTRRARKALRQAKRMMESYQGGMNRSVGMHENMVWAVWRLRTPTSIYWWPLSRCSM